MGRASRLLRFVHRLLIKTGVVALPVAWTVSWLAAPTPVTVATRWALPLFAALVAPIVVLRWLRPPTTVYMLCTRFGLWPAGRKPTRVSYDWTRLDRIAPEMSLAVLVSEDPYFFWHAGFNPIEIVRAHRYNRLVREPGRMRRGGSTISQQVAKNLFFVPKQSWARKILESLFTLLLEGLWPKRRILEMYLNIVEFGDGVFGVAAAARHFFDRGPSDLSREQAALLTAALRRPQIYRVDAPPPYMRELQTTILQRMTWCGEGMLAQLGE